MSTATRVPETFDLDGDDARQLLSDIGKRRLLRDAFVRLRAGDGTSHSRSLAFMVSLCLVQGLIVLLGIASFSGFGLTTRVADNLSGAIPGPAGSVLVDTVEQARKVGERHQFVPLLLGLLSLIVTTTFAMGQMERGVNRIYGVERDRPARRKYERAFILAITVGPMLATALLMIGFAPDPDRPSTTAIDEIWVIARWPVAAILVVVGLGLVLRYCPNRHQPGRIWLTFGALIAVFLWLSATVLLALGFRLSSTFPQTYGPLAGVIALLLWGYLSALAIFYGVAVAAELEAERANLRETLAIADDPLPVTATRALASSTD